MNDVVGGGDWFLSREVRILAQVVRPSLEAPGDESPGGDLDHPLSRKGAFPHSPGLRLGGFA